MKSPELTYLILIAILNGVLWIPVVIGYVSTRGTLKPKDYVSLPDSPLPNWVNRANRAHMNAVENLSPFAAIVLVAHVLEYSTEVTQLMAAIFFWFRLVHAGVFIAGLNRLMIRTVIFSLSNIAILVYGVVVLAQLF